MKAKYIKHYKVRKKVMEHWWFFVLKFKFKNKEHFIRILEAM